MVRTNFIMFMRPTLNLYMQLGPSIGPIIGGVLADKLGWRCVISCSSRRVLFLIPEQINLLVHGYRHWMLLYLHPLVSIVCLNAKASLISSSRFLPETLRSLVGNGSIPAQRWNRALLPILGRKTLSMSSERPPPKALPNPFRLFLEKDVLLILISQGILFAAFYAVTATLSTLFAVAYPFLSETEIGLCFLGVGIGGMIGTLTVGKLLDYNFNRIKQQREPKEKADADGPASDHDEDFPIEKACLQFMHIFVWAFSVAQIGYGWAVQARVNLAVPLILQFVGEFTPRFANMPSLNFDSWIFNGRRDDHEPNTPRRLIPNPGLVNHSCCTVSLFFDGSVFLLTTCRRTILCAVSWALRLFPSLTSSPTRFVLGGPTSCAAAYVLRLGL